MFVRFGRKLKLGKPLRFNIFLATQRENSELLLEVFCIAFSTCKKVLLPKTAISAIAISISTKIFTFTAVNDFFFVEIRSRLLTAGERERRSSPLGGINFGKSLTHFRTTGKAF